MIAPLGRAALTAFALVAATCVATVPAASAASPTGPAPLTTPVRDANGITVTDFAGHPRRIPLPKPPREPLAERRAAARTATPAAAPTQDVYYLANGGTRVVQLVGGTTPGAHRDLASSGDLAWSYDGSRLFLTDTSGMFSYTSLTDLHPVRIASDTGVVGAPAVHPRGWSVGYVGKQATYFIARSDGYGKEFTLANPPQTTSAVTYTGDGSHLIMTAERDTALEALYTVDLTVASPTATRLIPDAPGAAALQQRDAVLSPDLSRLAYVQADANGGNTAVWVMHDDGSNATKVVDVPNGVPTRGVAWTADGNRLYVATNGKLTYVSASGGALTPLADMAGAFLAPRPVSYPVTTFRASGTDPIDTAVKLSQHGFAPAPAGAARCANGNAMSVVLARSGMAAEGAIAGPLAENKYSTLLVTGPTTLDPRVRTEIKRVLKRGGTVYVVGGTGSVGTAAAATIVADGYKVTRFSGSTVYATATDVAVRGLGKPRFVVIADATKAADVAIAAPAAAANGGALLLTAGTAPAAATTSYLRTYQPNGVMIGATAAKAYTGAHIYGSNAYETAVATARLMLGTPRTAVLANPTRITDMVTAAGYGAATYNPLLLTPPTALAASTATLFDRGSAAISFVTAVGSSAALSGTVVNQAVTLARGQEGYLQP